MSLRKWRKEKGTEQQGLSKGVLSCGTRSGAEWDKTNWQVSNKIQPKLLIRIIYGALKQNKRKQTKKTQQASIGPP